MRAYVKPLFIHMNETKPKNSVLVRWLESKGMHIKGM